MYSLFIPNIFSKKQMEAGKINVDQQEGELIRRSHNLKKEEIQPQQEYCKNYKRNYASEHLYWQKSA